MKKAFSLVLACVMVIAMSVTTVARPTSDDLPFQIPASYNFSFEMNLGLDVQAPELLEDPEVAAVLAMLRNVVVTADGTVIADLDTLLAGHLHMEASVRAGFFYIPFTLWMDYDLTNPEAPVYAIIVELPEMLQAMIALEDPDLAKPFWVLDYAPLFAMEDMSGLFNVMVDSDMNAQMFSQIMGLMPEAEYLGDNNYRMVFNDESFTNFFIDIMQVAMEPLFDNSLMWDLVNAVEDIDEEEFEELLAELHEEINPFLEMVFELSRNVTFISQDWVTYITLDENGFVAQETSQAQFIFDLAEWTQALGVDPNFTGLPEVVITFDFDYSAIISNINNVTPVAPPVLTPENSVDLIEMLF
ncbi:MAG: hypothetical protein FWC91_12080 [Defluviitaleaceae bacterium]|nr:hypothetical protein [Defluviitaleaceae bacterium]